MFYFGYGLRVYYICCFVAILSIKYIQMFSIILFFLILIIPSFSYAKNDKKNVLTIDVAAAVEESGAMVNLSDYCSSIEYIPLETTLDAMLYQKMPYCTVIANKENIFYQSQNSLQVFSAKGKYLKMIGNIGRAKEEYTRIGDVSYYSNTIQVNDVGANKSIIYDVSGEVLEVVLHRDIEKSFNMNVLSGFMKIEGMSFITGRSENFNSLCIVMDEKNNILMRDSLVHKGGGVCSMYLYKDTVSLIYPFAEVIKGYDNKKLEWVDRFNVELGKNKALSDGSNIRNSMRLLSDGTVENDRFVRLRIMYNLPLKSYMRKDKKIVEVIYDKFTGHSFILPYNDELNGYAFKNDLDGGLPFVIDNMFENKIYQVVDAIKFIDLAKKSNSKRAREIADKLTEESNPIVIVATLR